MAVIEADFGGWATKAGLRCSDGRTIMRGAFEKMHHQQVPLVWQHGHSDAKNVLGHAVLEHRDEGVYAYAFFNDTEQGKNARSLVEHGDIKYLSIYANNLVEKGKEVLHGVIREVSLVLAGANPGAKIDFVNINHGDGDFETLEDEAVIHTGLVIDHAGNADEDDETDEDEGDELQHAEDDEDDDLTINDVYESFDEEQKNVVHYLIGVALQDAAKANSAEHSNKSADGGDLTHQEGAGNHMSRNVFDQTTTDDKGRAKHELSHDALKGIFADAEKRGSLKAAVEQYAKDNLQHGVENIDILFPDAKAATGVIELDKRRTEWVATVLNSTRHTPFSRIKTFAADLTQDEARAKGYIKGNYKREEWFGVTKRTTDPTTIYKKQKLDRDDLLDITDFDMVAFLKGEMRLMTEEEFARAVLIGDGRDIADEDKVKDPMGASSGSGIRSILNDHELFVTTLFVNPAATGNDLGYEVVVDGVMDGMEYYKGTGTPTFFTTIPELNKFLQARDLNGQRLYKNRGEVADALGVDKIVTVEPMKEISDLVGIIVNLADYNVGTDRGGELTMFDDFDIDYNQYKYLMETRASGALIRPKSALVIKKVASADTLVEPVQPTFNSTTGVVTIPTVTGVEYQDSNGTALVAGPQTALAAGASTTVYAVALDGYYFANTAEDSWTFKRKSA
ncbi:capsid maturation protease [Streptomyces phage FidgetOrca]|uniref:Capsid maturation protease n=2 Tax=Rimavirus rima TaxID=2560784 RepID=A0A1I9SDF2_9CAUD|nr:capsid maturation protease [Streptomyces phage OlympicHelado]QGJ96713.1 capsid maturation protease [Streptomyces phage FidgetOrca]